jgi:hypothetical protein
MAFGTLRADTIQADGGTAKTVDNLVVSGGDIGAATATTPATGDDDTSVLRHKHMQLLLVLRLLAL